MRRLLLASLVVLVCWLIGWVLLADWLVQAMTTSLLQDLCKLFV